MKRSFTFTRDYTARHEGRQRPDAHGPELMRLTAYRGQLFASTSTFTDPRGYIDDPDYTGCQVLRKSSSHPSGRWMLPSGGATCAPTTSM